MCFIGVSCMIENYGLFKKIKKSNLFSLSEITVMKENEGNGDEDVRKNIYNIYIPSF